MLKQHIPAAPRIVERPPQRMAVIETVGDPDEVGGRAVGALYGAIAQLGLESGPLCARWPNAARAPKSEWVARWALPVPDHTPELGSGIVLETWYGRPTAEVVHEGAFGNSEVVTVKRLHRFIHDCGYEIVGPPEEEYLTKPGEEPKRTAIRFEISQLPH
jgi:effector-binding domain-containing protein